MGIDKSARDVIKKCFRLEELQLENLAVFYDVCGMYYSSFCEREELYSNYEVYAQKLFKANVEPFIDSKVKILVLLADLRPLFVYKFKFMASDSMQMDNIYDPNPDLGNDSLVVKIPKTDSKIIINVTPFIPEYRMYTSQKRKEAPEKKEDLKNVSMTYSSSSSSSSSSHSPPPSASTKLLSTSSSFENLVNLSKKFEESKIEFSKRYADWINPNVLVKPQPSSINSSEYGHLSENKNGLSGVHLHKYFNDIFHLGNDISIDLKNFDFFKSDGGKPQGTLTNAMHLNLMATPGKYMAVIPNILNNWLRDGNSASKIANYVQYLKKNNHSGINMPLDDSGFYHRGLHVSYRPLIYNENSGLSEKDYFADNMKERKYDKTVKTGSVKKVYYIPPSPSNNRSEGVLGSMFDEPSFLNGSCPFSIEADTGSISMAIAHIKNAKSIPSKRNQTTSSGPPHSFQPEPKALVRVDQDGDLFLIALTAVSHIHNNIGLRKLYLSCNSLCNHNDWGNYLQTNVFYKNEVSKGEGKEKEEEKENEENQGENVKKERFCTFFGEGKNTIRAFDMVEVCQKIRSDSALIIKKIKADPKVSYDIKKRIIENENELVYTSPYFFVLCCILSGIDYFEKIPYTGANKYLQVYETYLMNGGSCQKLRNSKIWEIVKTSCIRDGILDPEVDDINLFKMVVHLVNPSDSRFNDEPNERKRSREQADEDNKNEKPKPANNKKVSVERYPHINIVALINLIYFATDANVSISCDSDSGVPKAGRKPKELALDYVISKAIQARWSFLYFVYEITQIRIPRMTSAGSGFRFNKDNEIEPIVFTSLCDKNVINNAIYE